MHTGHLALARVAHLPHAVVGGTLATATATVAVTATAVMTAIVPHGHVPSIPGGGIVSVAAGVPAPSDGAPTPPPATGPGEGR